MAVVRSGLLAKSRPRRARFQGQGPARGGRASERARRAGSRPNPVAGSAFEDGLASVVGSECRVVGMLDLGVKPTSSSS